MRRPFLARGVVRFVGEPVAVVVAETAAQGADAAELVEVDYEPLPAVVDPEAAAARTSCCCSPRPGTNVVLRAGTEGAGRLLAAARSSSRQRLVNQRIAGGPHRGPGRRRPTGPTTAASSTTPRARAPTRPADVLAQRLRARAERRSGWSSPTSAAASAPRPGPTPRRSLLGLLARRRGPPGALGARPAPRTWWRMAHGRGQVQHVTIGGTRDGRITAYQLDVVQDAGAYPLIGAHAHQHDPAHADRRVRPRQRRLQRRRRWPPTPRRSTAFRGAGRPEAAAAIERAVDLFAAEIGLDPAEVRRRNLVAPFADAVHDRGRHRLRRRRLRRRARPGARRRRLRRRCGPSRPAGGPPATTRAARHRRVGLRRDHRPAPAGGEYGSVELLADGGALVVTGSTPYGQGHDTAWSMIVADRTGVPHGAHRGRARRHRRRPRRGHHRRLARRCRSAGAAVADASAKLVEAARQQAADLLEANRRRRRARPGGRALPRRRHPGVARRLGRGGRRRPATALHRGQRLRPPAAHVPLRRPRGRGRGRPGDRAGRRSCGSSPSTTPARSSTRCSPRARCTAASAQGVAQALLEEVRFDDDGNPLTTNFADYALISSPPSCPTFELVAAGDADLRQRARRQGHRRVGHDRRHAGRAERGGRRAGPPRRPPPRHARARPSGSGGRCAAARSRLNRRVGAVGVAVGSR